jgi:shikimate kinase
MFGLEIKTLPIGGVFLLCNLKNFFKINAMKIKLDKPIVMVGLMGAGKTSVGRALAHHLGVPFVDSDKEIERAAGCSVVDIFSLYGEKEFRRVERQVVDRLIDSPPRVKVISTGEGAFITPEIRERVLKDAISIWLKADLDLLVKRTQFRNTRPQLLNNDSKKILAQLIAERYNTYAMANITVETFDESLHKTLTKVVDALTQNQKEQNNGK